MNRVALFGLCTVLAACAPVPEPVQSEAQSVESQVGTVEPALHSIKVTRVIDGDTLELENGDRVRLLCIDTPERGEEGYAEATDFLRKLVEGREVELEADPEHDDQDRFGRLLRYVFVHHWSDVVGHRVSSPPPLVNALIVEAGHSRYWTKYGASSLYDNAFREAENRD